VRLGRHNFECFDILAEKDGQLHIIAVTFRNHSKETGDAKDDAYFLYRNSKLIALARRTIQRNPGICRRHRQRPDADPFGLVWASFTAEVVDGRRPRSRVDPDAQARRGGALRRSCDGHLIARPFAAPSP
jgi:hypothetical protein